MLKENRFVLAMRYGKGYLVIIETFFEKLYTHIFHFKNCLSYSATKQLLLYINHFRWHGDTKNCTLPEFRTGLNFKSMI